MKRMSITCLTAVALAASLDGCRPLQLPREPGASTGDSKVAGGSIQSMNKLMQSFIRVAGGLLFLCSVHLPVIAQNFTEACQGELSRERALAGPAGMSAEVRAREITGVMGGCNDVNRMRAAIDELNQLSSLNWSPLQRAEMDVAKCLRRTMLKFCSDSIASSQSARPNITAGSSLSSSAVAQQTDAASLANKQKADADRARQEEFKRQKDKTAQYDASWALERTKMAQGAVDAIRKDKRTRHRPDGEAHNCLQLKKAGLYGGFNNTCSVPVTYFFCHYQPRKDSWGESLDCEKGKIGMGTVQANTGAAEHTYNSAMIYWFACKKDFTPADAEFVLGQGLRGRCIQ